MGKHCASSGMKPPAARMGGGGPNLSLDGLNQKIDSLSTYLETRVRYPRWDGESTLSGGVKERVMTGNPRVNRALSGLSVFAGRWMILSCLLLPSGVTVAQGNASAAKGEPAAMSQPAAPAAQQVAKSGKESIPVLFLSDRSEEHTSELQS